MSTLTECEHPGCNNLVPMELKHVCGGFAKQDRYYWTCTGYFCDSHLMEVSEIPATIQGVAPDGARFCLEDGMHVEDAWKRHIEDAN